MPYTVKSVGGQISTKFLSNRTDEEKKMIVIYLTVRKIVLKT